jgi:hypothetical protein
MKNGIHVNGWYSSKIYVLFEFEFEKKEDKWVCKGIMKLKIIK